MASSIADGLWEVRFISSAKTIWAKSGQGESEKRWNSSQTQAHRYRLRAAGQCKLYPSECGKSLLFRAFLRFDGFAQGFGQGGLDPENLPAEHGHRRSERDRQINHIISAEYLLLDWLASVCSTEIACCRF